MRFIVLMLAALTIAGCGTTSPPPSAETSSCRKSSTAADWESMASSCVDSGCRETWARIRAGDAWREAHDLDGDGLCDRIDSEFSGGAHCCYRVGAALSSTGEAVMLPFEFDGDYVGGLDPSQPDRFAIRTREAGLPELMIEIQTYNGELLPLDPEWTRRYGIRTHRIAACFAGGRVQVRDQAPDLPPCRKNGPGRASGL
jgi:hypothetical protein